MAININKRLKYFNTESEYLAYVASQRAAADAGTLELYETTVCCITHGDTTTPDSYHPSTEPGYTDVTFKYNEDDDIRYIKFINPSWYLNGCTLSPVGSGYQPVLSAYKTLPDVIDGQQITRLEASNFTQKLISWPDFSNIHVEYLEINNNNSYTYTLPESWPALKELSYSGKFVKTPLGESNYLDAPLLETITVDCSNEGTVAPQVWDSEHIKNFKYSTYYNPQSINLDDILPNSHSTVESVEIHFQQHSNLVFHHGSTGLRWCALYGLTKRNKQPSENIPVTLRLYSDGEVVSFNNGSSFVGVDFNGSSFDGDTMFLYNYQNPNEYSLHVQACTSTGTEYATFAGILTHKNDYFIFDNLPSNVYMVDVSYPQVNNITINVDVDNLIKDVFTINCNYNADYGVHPYITINVNGDTSKGLFVATDSTVTSGIILNNSTDYIFKTLRLGSSSTASRKSLVNVTNGVIRVPSASALVNYSTVTSPITLYTQRIDSVSFMQAHSVHAPSAYIMDATGGNDITLYLEPFFNGTSYYDKNNRFIQISLVDDIGNLNFIPVLVDDETIAGFSGIILNMSKTGLSMNSINECLESVENFIPLIASSSRYNSVTIHKSYYDQLDTTHLGIFNSFRDRTIIEN